MAQYDLSAMVEQATEALGGDKATFTWKGKEYEIVHPALATDDFKADLAECGDEVDAAVFLLGEAKWKQFKGDGGQAGHITLFLGNLARETQAALVDGTPTRSGMSSRSTRRQSKRR